MMDRIERTAQALRAAAIERGIALTGDGRIGETDLAGLLAVHPLTVRGWRDEAKGPRAYRVGVNGCRVSYSLLDVAEWIETRRDA